MKEVIMKRIEFTLNNIEYIIQDVPGKSYKEILYKNTMRRVTNQKDVCRQYGINVSTDANVMNTHQAIDLLVERLCAKNIKSPSASVRAANVAGF